MTLDGALWFPSVDVARAIGMAPHTVASNVRRTVDEDEVMLVHRKQGLIQFEVDLFSNTTAPCLTLVSESGLYKFVIKAQSSNPFAKGFQDWVTQVVLPTIRKDGAYIMGEEKVALGELSAEDILDKLPTILGKKIRELEAAAQQWARKAGWDRTSFFAPSSIVTAAERADFPLSP